MRATAPSMKPTDVWDVLLASITTPASIGELLDDMGAIPTTRQFTEYSYGPTALADGATFVPPAKTIITQAVMDDSVTFDTGFKLMDTAIASAYKDVISAFSIQEENRNSSITRMVVCDGSDVGYMNSQGSSKPILLRGLTMA